MSEKNIIDVARKVLEVESNSLIEASKKLGEGFTQAIEILECVAPNGRVVVVGMGKSGHIGNKIAATLASTGTPAFTVHPAEAGHGDLGMLTKYDVVIAISQSGKSDEVLQIIPYIKRHNIKMIAMTGQLDSALARSADAVINTAVEKEACPLGLAPTASTTLTLALGDALAVCLLERAGFSADDFAETHPNGLLGRKLLVTVGGAMSSLSEVAIVQSGSTIRNALPIIAKGGMGLAVICSDDFTPIGVFTDGDLRRCLDNDADIRKAIVDDYMTREYHSIFVESLAVKAVNVMGEEDVSVLPVVNRAGILEGAIGMKNLISAGVV